MQHGSADDHWWQDVFHELRTATSTVDAFERMRSFTERLGFPFCSFGVRYTSAASLVETEILDSYPRGWMDHYKERGYVRIDPTVSLGTRRRDPFIWCDQIFATAPKLWRDARDVGLRVGIATPSWGCYGFFGLLSIARDQAELSESEFKSLRPKLRWLAENIRGQVQGFLVDDVDGGIEARLSTREVEVMSWTAEGKTCWEIAQIMGISESTANFHVKNVITKLKAQNKVHAAAKAISLGLLSQ